MRFVYNILFFLFFWLTAPFYFLKMWRRGNWRANFGQRFGFYSDEFKAAVAGKQILWLHAVSVGEVGVCLQLISALEKHLPGWQLLVTTTTSTGMGELQKRLPSHVHRAYYPIDFPGAVRRALDVINPRAVVLVEADLWTNFMWQANDRGIGLFLVNARISDRSFARYRKVGFIFRPNFARFRGAGCQQADEARLIELGFPREAVRVTGSLKFDAAQPGPGAGLNVPALLRQIGVSAQAPLLVAGSTHAGEEGILADMLPRLRQRFPNLFLVLVPRHFERAKDVARELDSRGVKYIRRTEIPAGEPLPAGKLECLLVDSTGELKFFYEQAAVVFVGKSLTAHGGQNPIEPAALCKAVVFGPHMENFAFATRAFFAAQAVVQAPDAAGLESAVAELLGDERHRAELGARARQVVQQNLGATGRTVQLILDGLATVSGTEKTS